MKFAFIVALIGWLSFAPVGTRAALAAGGDSSESGPPSEGLLASNYVTYWALDPTGYHPSILVMVENQTGRDLTGERIRFQARFLNIRTGMVTVARTDIRKQFHPRERIQVYLHGADPFELPISTSDWPPLECKVMARIADVGDEGTQNLVVTDVDKVTMDQDEAFRAIEKIYPYTQASAADIKRSLPQGKPLKAVPASLKPSGSNTAAQSPQPPFDKPIHTYLHSPDTPGLGDDFARFEHRFGLPLATEKTLPGWTWASYSHSDPSLEVLAASKGHGGVDVLLVQLTGYEVKSEAEAIQLARDLSGKLKAEKPGPPARSVRYLTAGRVELITARAPDFQFTCFPQGPNTGSGTCTLVLSRVPGSIEQLIAEHSKHSKMLRPYAGLFEK